MDGKKSERSFLGLYGGVSFGGWHMVSDKTD